MNTILIPRWPLLSHQCQHVLSSVLIELVMGFQLVSWFGIRSCSMGLENVGCVLLTTMTNMVKLKMERDYCWIVNWWNGKGFGSLGKGKGKERGVLKPYWGFWCWWICLCFLHDTWDVEGWWWVLIVLELMVCLSLDWLMGELIDEWVATEMKEIDLNFISSLKLVGYRPFGYTCQ